VVVPFVVPLIKTVAPGKGAPFSSVTLPEIGWARDTTFTKGAFVLKNTSLSIFLENAWEELTLSPAQDIKHAQAHMIFDNRTVEYINLRVGWLNFFDIYGLE
jgi:hypothetical protein